MHTKQITTSFALAVALLSANAWAGNGANFVLYNHHTEKAGATAAMSMAALVLASAATFAGGTHGDNPVGEPGKAAEVTRTINVDMTDNMRFTPANISVTQGETVHFVVKNSGAVKHELVLGTPAELKEHYAMMMKMPGMEHADDNMVSVAPGKTGEVVWRFTKAGKVDFACLQPGHYDAGMNGIVSVAHQEGASKADGHGGHKH